VVDSSSSVESSSRGSLGVAGGGVEVGEGGVGVGPDVCCLVRIAWPVLVRARELAMVSEKTLGGYMLLAGV
jgi:hypothetical protein